MSKVEIDLWRNFAIPCTNGTVKEVVWDLFVTRKEVLTVAKKDEEKDPRSHEVSLQSENGTNVEPV